MDEQNGKYPTSKLKRYPHMFALDIAIWERFLDLHGSEYLGFDYDIKVGTGTPAPEGTPDNYARMQEILSKYRIDAVGYTESEIHVIEVKPEAGTTAIGQIDIYVPLYRRDFSPTRKVVGVIVTNRELPDVKWRIAQKNAKLFIV